MQNSPSSTSPPFTPTSRLWTVGLVAGLLATLLNVGLALILGPALNVPSSFAPFQPVTIVVACVLGSLVATLAYVLLRRFVTQPDSTFTVLALFALLASFALPWSIGDSTSPRFAGVTLEIQLALSAMHVITAACAVFLLLRQTRER
jgi:drug/metabolite transporter (DMT)-like permease